MSSMSTDEQPGRRRRLGSTVCEIAGLALVSTGLWVADVTFGLIAAGVSLLWIGWSSS